MTKILSPFLADFIDFNNVDPCPIGGVSCVGANESQDYLENLLTGNQGLLTIFTGVVFAMFLFYGIKLLLGSRSDNVITEVRQAYGHAFFGVVIVGAAILLADTFASNTDDIVVESAFNTGTSNVINFVAALIATLVLANIVVQGIRLVIALEDGDIDKAKKGFLHGMIGAGIAILALPFVRTFTAVETSGGGGITSGGVESALTQIIGIGQYVTLILGAIAVFGVLVAGIMLVVSYDEGLQDRARKLIVTCLITLAVCLVAYGLVTLFITDSLTAT